MRSEFKVGDLVRIKSGGPPMTVTSVSKLSGSVSINCVWFDSQDRKREHYFDAVVLVLVPEASSGVSIGYE